MFLTRSIRRKLCIVLSIFVGLLALLFGAGFMGLLSYGSMVSEIEKNLRASPKRYEILAATSRLMDPTLRRDAFALSRLLVDLESAMSEYRLQQVKLPNSPENRGQSSIAFAILQKMDNDIARMKDKLPALESQQIAYVAQQEMTESLASLQKSALSLPNPIEGLQKLWQDSRSTYQICFWMLIGVAVCTLLAIGIVTHLSIRWIFFPIKELHRGATKVARGDFSVRVQLKGQDEIVDLAHALNAMTQRFCEIKADLDRQVNERSRQLVRSERLAGVGFLAAGVAHEINNPLSAISMASESLASRVAGSEGTGLAISADDADVARQYLEMIQTEAARCQEITSRLLNFARGQDAPRGLQDVTRIIHDVVQMVGHMGKYSGHHIEFVPMSAVHAEINGSEIKQVILNLVANSLESMGTSGGRLAIEVKELSDEICLTFTDTGCGMTARVLENLFEPFFTERKSGRGTGLGLSISHRIVTDHGGRIEAQSDGPGLGSTFRVHLPKRASQSMAA